VNALTTRHLSNFHPSVATIIPLIYAILTFRRLEQYDDYLPTTGLKHHPRGDDFFEMGNSVQIFASGPPADKRASYLSDDTSYASPQTGGARSPPPPKLKIHVDRAVGTEFGWGSGHPSAGRVERSGSLVGTGCVRGRRGRAAEVEGFGAARRDSERAVVDAEEDVDDMEVDDDDDGDTVRGSRDGGGELGGGERVEGEDDTQGLLASQGRWGGERIGVLHMGQS